MERELTRKCRSQALLYNAGRELTVELNRYLNGTKAREAWGVAPEGSQLQTDAGLDLLNHLPLPNSA